ncbi:SLAM family member 9-like isoform X2 [Electrophorus electricus]|uniref:SLAM family member 9-like isoform X2 n=1 Tax=Electrophorus electricus TaxID=8005 RepID=UPI0015CFB4D8|nr:SLAM family member 9-like isoform X2 [Electrophorus electricus]
MSTVHKWKTNTFLTQEFERGSNSLTMMVVQRILVLSVFVSFAVSHEELRLIGTSVQMDAQDHESTFEEFIWRFNKTINLIKYYNETKKMRVNPSYEGRVEFNIETYSLTLKNLQKKDSGLYEAQVSHFNDKIVAMYSLSVLDPVETPGLTYVLDKQIGDPCNISLTCKGHGLSVISSCFNKTCEKNKNITREGITLYLSVINSSSVICNISNPVSWNMSAIEMKDLKQVCHRKGAEKEDQAIPGLYYPLLLIAVILVVVVVIGVLMKKKPCKTNSTGSSQGDTVYAEVENGNGKPAAMLDKLGQPSTVYSVVGKPAQSSGSEESNGTTPNTLYQELETQVSLVETSTHDTSGVLNMKQVTMERPHTLPETVYATVCKANK